MTDYPYATRALAMPHDARRDRYATAAMYAQRAGNFDPSPISVYRASRRPDWHPGR